jgi:HAD superfamily hydrolase (TIGR01490 family)
LQLDHGGVERQPIVVTPAAFFDMDRTLIRVNSGTLWIRWLRKRGELSLYETVRGLAWIAQYKLSLLDMEAVAEKATASMRGQLEGDLVKKAREFFDGLIAAEVSPKALAAIERHRQQGHVVAILSSSTPYVVEPLAAQLGIDHAICSRMNVTDGRFVGTHKKPMCYGAGKVHWAEEFARAHDVDLAKSFFYSDSYTDLPMLERVGIARVVNPDTRLKRHAKRVGWHVDEW